MIAAIYARKSTEQEKGASGASESVERQIEHAKAYAGTHGCAIPREHVYFDDNVSGAAYAKLEARNRMVADAEAGKFQVLVVSEQSRLGRDMIEVAYTIKRIAESGVKILAYLDDAEISVEDEIQQTMTVLRSFASASERRQTSRRVFDAELRRVRAGAVAGAKIYGYDNVRGPDGLVRRVINPAQAAVVVRIFTMYAEGIGSSTIADRLNDEDVPAPRPKGWAQAGVKHQLRNEIYRGVVVWGRSQNVVRKGRKTNRLRPAAEWIRLEAPELRIVGEELWNRVQAERQRRRRAYPRSAKTGRLLGRPSWHDGHSDYLVTGHARCTGCGGSIRVTHRRHGTAPNRVVRRSYLCATRDVRGPAKCANDVLVRVDRLDRALRDALADVLEDPALLDAAVDRALARLRASQQQGLDRRAALARELAQVQHRLDRGLDAFLDGQGAMPEVRAKIEADRQRKDALTVELASLAAAAAVASLDGERVKHRLRAYAADLRGLLASTTPQARAALRTLLAGRLIEVAPVRHPDGRTGFHFRGVIALPALTLVFGREATNPARPTGAIETGTCAAGRAPARRACGCRRPA